MQANQLKQSIQEAMKTAMRAQEKDRLLVIRLILSAMKQKEVDERIELDDTQILVILDKMLSQRKESIAQYQAAKRDDLVQKEVFETTVIQSFMPAPLEEAEVEKLIQAALKETGATSIRDLSKVMAILKPQLQGRADLSQVSQKIKASFD
ncbi:MAG: GatB/YqeY domain-containing protein [Gammaproteobacteria bacterium]